MQPSSSRILAVLLSYLIAQTKAYPMQGWSVYPQTAREYPEEDYYYSPKVQYYYEPPAPAAQVPEVYGQVPYPAYYYDPYSHFTNEDQKSEDERFAALPIGQETWFESEPTPRWQANDDDVSAAFLDNLILTQMAQDAQRRRENTRAAFPPADYEERDAEDEDVRELKALAGKPFYHVPKTVPRIDDDDYAADDGFINWNGNKRSVTTAAPVVSTLNPKLGQQEIMVGIPAPTAKPRGHQITQNKRNPTERTAFYDTLVHLLENKSSNKHIQDATKVRNINKRFVSDNRDLAFELRGLKHRIAT